MKKNDKKRQDIILIILCWAAYSFAQLGRYSYNSNVILIMDKFAVDHAMASIPATLFFFAYGAGQIVVGLFCSRFNRRVLVTLALASTALLNIAVFLSNRFFIIKYLWLLNGFVQAILWPTLLLILKENVSKEKMGVASVVMATASLGGRFAAIGICALFAVDVSLFTYCFLTAGIVLFAMSVVFFAVAGNIKKPERKNIVKVSEERKEGKADRYAVFLLILLGEFSFACYAINDGLQQWVPSIMKENYGLTDSISIFISTFLPLFSLPTAFIAPYLCKKMKNYSLIAFIFFTIGAAAIIGVLLFIDVHWLPVMILFVMEAIMLSIISNTTTVQIPLTFKGKFNAGFLAGYLNGSCYIGMASSTYVLGHISDVSGWTSVLILLIAIAAVSAALAGIYLIVEKWRKQKLSKEESVGYVNPKR